MALFSEETISVRGRSTRLFHGGDGPSVIFLHDAFCPSWLPLHDKLASEFEVFVPIHPGFAGSEDHFDQFETMEDLVIHYLDLCEALRLERPALAGASFGGWIAAEWAIRYSHRLQSLILIDSLGLRLEAAPVADVLSLDGTALRQTLFSDANSPLAMETLSDTPKADAIVSTILGRRTLARFAWQFPDNPRLLRYLYRARLPALILWGERDGYVPLAHGKAYHEGIANSQLAAIPSVGHLPHLEAPEECAKLMSRFLRKK
ncbi:MAG TPA: alpha/beta hydrolase [Candidatus Binatia bacterium]|jgi:pimeloyl-ACP methyl ester carboxylesterase